MTLQERLDAIKTQAQGRIPPEAQAIMQRNIEDLRASGILARVPKVSERAPDFTLPDATGHPVSLQVLRAQGSVVLSFYRGRWWPYCSAELEALRQALPEITALGATLAVISPQVQRTARESEDQTLLPFAMLRDQGNRVAAQYGLVFTLPDDLRQLYAKFGIDLARANGDDSWTLPMPARFVIDRAGLIRQADVDPDYTRRSEPAHTVEVLRRLSA
jgi:peroxiredoxin